jgi:hypothetical protein
MKTKIYILIGLFLVGLVCYGLIEIFLSTGTGHRKVAQYTGHSSICIDGVEYIQFMSGASVAYTPDGKIKVCK